MSRVVSHFFSRKYVKIVYHFIDRYSVGDNVDEVKERGEGHHITCGNEQDKGCSALERATS